MTTHPIQAKLKKVRLSLKEKINLLIPYAKKKIFEQIKSVALIVVYLVLFQTLVLGIPIAESLVIAVGISVIILGLAFFMEGLFLGLMPLGETIGIKLPQKTKLPVILGFSLILGVGVTFAEPAIGVLQIAGSFIKAWDAPLLFALLNKYSSFLKYAVGIGVGLAVVAGMLRFMFNWSLKPFLYMGVPITLALSLWANFEPNMVFLAGLAWDCGGVTTGPVTVPLVLALGIGVCRVVSKNTGDSGGFGVVTLASLFPIITVFALGIALLPTVPQPTTPQAFFSQEFRQKSESLFETKDALISYALQSAPVEAQVALFDGNKGALMAFIGKLKTDPELRQRVFGGRGIEVLERWAVSNGDQEQRLLVFGDREKLKAAVHHYTTGDQTLDVGDISLRNGIASLQAILPLVAFLLIVLVLILRERLRNPDVIFVGVVFALVGMFLFNIGIELGLSKLGNQIGAKLPASFKKVELVEQATNIPNFDESVVQTAVKPNGELLRFFYVNQNNAYVQIPFDPQSVDPVSHAYNYVPTKGPMFGEEGNLAGVLLVLLFAFIMGYGATLAEPALNALGSTVESLTVGAFKKSLLMQSVAVGVGLGIAVGVMKIVWGIPLIWLLAPPYLVLIILSKISTEDFVNIGWDSAGVTTGPITVPLVLAMGLGLSGQVGAVEGFGILATASVFPILSVLATGIVVSLRRKALMRPSAT